MSTDCRLTVGLMEMYYGDYCSAYGVFGDFGIKA